MAQALQHDQAALIAELSTTGSADIKPDNSPELALRNVVVTYRVWRRFAEEGRLDVPCLVIVVQRGFGCDDLLLQIARDPSVKGRIIVVLDDELKWLYQNCRFTLYPSFVEGWGLPISESLANGKVCIASNTSSMPEAGQGLSIHIDPIDILGWYECVSLLSKDTDDLAVRERRIQTEYQPKSWHDTAQEIAKLLSGFLPASKPDQLVEKPFPLSHQFKANAS